MNRSYHRLTIVVIIIAVLLTAALLTLMLGLLFGSGGFP